MAFFLVCSLALLFILALLGQPAWAAYRRRRVMATVFPARWRRILKRRVPLVRRMPPDLQLQLKKRMQVFIAEKSFIGCGGLRVSEEMRVVVAAQACLLLLNRNADYFANVRHILLYPATFVVQRPSTDTNGVQQVRHQMLAGESWELGQVVLSWGDVLAGAANATDGHNVVIHEFAHQLDSENGPPNGAPPPLLGDAQHNPRRWSRVFHAAYARLQAEVHGGVQGVLNHYGAHSPAEFFAVVSEAFFEQPVALAQDYPDLYAELRGYYKVDPASW